MTILIGFIVTIFLAIVISAAGRYFKDLHTAKHKDVKLYTLYALENGDKLVVKDSCKIEDLYTEFIDYKNYLEIILNGDYKVVESSFLYIKYISRENPKEYITLRVAIKRTKNKNK